MTSGDIVTLTVPLMSASGGMFRPSEYRVERVYETSGGLRAAIRGESGRLLNSVKLEHLKKVN